MRFYFAFVLFFYINQSTSYAEYIIIEGTVTGVQTSEQHPNLNYYIGASVLYVYHIDFTRMGYFVTPEGIFENQDSYNLYDDIIVRPEFFPEPGYHQEFDYIIEGHMGNHWVGPNGFLETYELNSRHDGRYTNASVNLIGIDAFLTPREFQYGYFYESTFDNNGSVVSIDGVINSVSFSDQYPSVPEPSNLFLLGVFGVTIFGLILKRSQIGT